MTGKNLGRGREAKIAASGFVSQFFLKFDRDRFPGFFVRHLEKILRLETERVGHEIGRENFQLGVEIADIAVVEAAGGHDLVFRIREFALEFQEILVRFQFGIIFRQGENAFQGGR